MKNRNSKFLSIFFFVATKAFYWPAAKRLVALIVATLIIAALLHNHHHFRKTHAHCCAYGVALVVSALGIATLIVATSGALVVSACEEDAQKKKNARENGSVPRFRRIKPSA